MIFVLNAVHRHNLVAKFSSLLEAFELLQDKRVRKATAKLGGDIRQGDLKRKLSMANVKLGSYKNAKRLKNGECRVEYQ